MVDSVADRLAPEEGWEELSPGERRRDVVSQGGPGARQSHSKHFFVPSSASDDRLALKMYRRACDNNLVGKVWFGRGALGAPGHIHGGALVAVADQALGHAAWFSGHPSFTARLEYDFRRRVPVDSVLTVETEVGEPEGRKLWLRARLWLEQELVGEASGLFLEIPAHTVREFHDP